MGLNANNIKMPKKESKFKPAEALDAASYPARVVRVLDLGLQAQKPYQGQEKPNVHMVDITYELTTEFLFDANGEEDPTKPRWISEQLPFYSLEVERAKSTQRYNAIDPKGVAGGDFTQLTGMPCVVTLNQYKTKTGGDIRNGVSMVTPIMKGVVLPDLVNEPKTFILDDPDLEVLGSLPQWLQDKIKGNLEFKGSTLEEALTNPPAKVEKKEEPKEEKKEKPVDKGPDPAPEDQAEDGEDIPW